MLFVFLSNRWISLLENSSLSLAFSEFGCVTNLFVLILLLSQLVRFYGRIGFKPVYEVTGSSIGDVTHMLVWGGRGTRMDADIEELMAKWGPKFKDST